jgi:anthranilate/para-aminobenzoate synthase component II
MISQNTQFKLFLITIFFIQFTCSSLLGQTAAADLESTFKLSDPEQVEILRRGFMSFAHSDPDEFYYSTSCSAVTSPEGEISSVCSVELMFSGQYVSLNTLQELYLHLKPDVHPILFISRLLFLQKVTGLKSNIIISHEILNQALKDISYSTHYTAWRLQRLIEMEQKISSEEKERLKLMWFNQLQESLNAMPNASSNSKALEFMVVIKKLMNESSDSIINWILNNDESTNDSTHCVASPEICLSILQRHFWVELSEPSTQAKIQAFIAKHNLSNTTPLEFNNLKNVLIAASFQNIELSVINNDPTELANVIDHFKQCHNVEEVTLLGQQLVDLIFSEQTNHLTINDRASLLIEVIWHIQTHSTLPVSFLDEMLNNISAHEFNRLLIIFHKNNLLTNELLDHALEYYINKSEAEANVALYFKQICTLLELGASLDLFFSRHQFLFMLTDVFNVFYDTFDMLPPLESDMISIESTFHAASQFFLNHALTNGNSEYLDFFLSSFFYLQQNNAFINSPIVIDFLNQLKINHFDYIINSLLSMFAYNNENLHTCTNLLAFLMNLKSDDVILYLATQLNEKFTKEIYESIKNYLHGDNFNQFIEFIESFNISIADLSRYTLQESYIENKHFSQQTLEILFSSEYNISHYLRSDYPQVVIRALEELQKTGLHNYYLIGISALTFGYTDGIDNVSEHFIKDKQHAYIVHIHPELLERKDLLTHFSVLINPGYGDSYYEHEVDLLNFKLSQLKHDRLYPIEKTYQAVIEFSKKYSIPYLGLCAGHQHLALHSGSSIQAVNDHHRQGNATLHGPSLPFYFALSKEEQQQYIQRNSTMELHIPNAKFAHSYAVRNDDLEDTIVRGYSDAGVVAAIQLDTGIHFGFQFHPERGFFSNLAVNRQRLLLENFFNLTFDLYKNKHYAITQGFDASDPAFSKHVVEHTHHFDSVIAQSHTASKSDPEIPFHWNSVLEHQTIQLIDNLTIHLPFGNNIEDVIVRRHENGITLALRDNASLLHLAGNTSTPCNIKVKSIGFSFVISIDSEGNISSSGIFCEKIDLPHDAPNETPPQESPVAELLIESNTSEPHLIPAA